MPLDPNAPLTPANPHYQPPNPPRLGVPVHDPNPGLPRIGKAETARHLARWLLPKVLSVRLLTTIVGSNAVAGLPIDPGLKATIIGGLAGLLVVARTAEDVAKAWKGTGTDPLPK